MKRSSWEGQTLVYRFGCPAKADFDPAALAQLRLAHDLRNELVAIYRRYEDEVAHVWASCCDVTELSTHVSQRADHLRLVLERVRTAKVQGRSQAVPAELRREAAEARRQLRAAKDALRVAKNRVFADLRPAFAASSERMWGDRKATYAEWVQRRGLYWATYSDVVTRFDTTVAAVGRLRREGRPAEVRFHRYDGTGTLTVQLQREAKDPPRTPQVLASETSKWRNVVRFPRLPETWEQMGRGERRRAARVTALIRVGRAETGGPQWLAVPTIQHRPIPDDADVTRVQVTRRRIAGQHRLALTVTCRLPSVERANPLRPTVAIDVGWRSLGDGRIRVAALEADASPGPITVPHHLREVILFGPAGRQGEVILPASWTAQFAQVKNLAGVRARKLEVLRRRLAEWLGDHREVCETLDLDISAIVKWRSPAQFAALALRWRGLRINGDAEMFEAIESWRRRDRHLWEWQDHQRRQILDRRRDAWRVLGSILADCFSTVVVENMDFAAMSRVPNVETGDEQRDMLARAQRVLAAPGDLRQAVLRAAERRGVKTIAADTTGLTTVHHRCGHDLSRQVDFAAGVLVFCPYCEETFDQDLNACRRLLERTSVGVGSH
ncbi:MAG: hypothetical protein M3083_20710 [Actinomycetota bacterium]|nr:hypothetical protein [Actinomycetota bacterium]